jgi:hypothetical protein
MQDEDETAPRIATSPRARDLIHNNKINFGAANNYSVESTTHVLQAYFLKKPSDFGQGL